MEREHCGLLKKSREVSGSWVQTHGVFPLSISVIFFLAWFGRGKYDYCFRIGLLRYYYLVWNILILPWILCIAKARDDALILGYYLCACITGILFVCMEWLKKLLVTERSWITEILSYCKDTNEKLPLLFQILDYWDTISVLGTDQILPSILCIANVRLYAAISVTAPFIGHFIFVGKYLRHKLLINDYWDSVNVSKTSKWEFFHLLQKEINKTSKWDSVLLEGYWLLKKINCEITTGALPMGLCWWLQKWWLPNTHPIVDMLWLLRCILVPKLL
jgi:hypothetical protein